MNKIINMIVSKITPNKIIITKNKITVVSRRSEMKTRKKKNMTMRKIMKITKSMKKTWHTQKGKTTICYKLIKHSTQS